MTTVALLGAGFSRNWGGWLANEAFEYLLGCPEIVKNSDVRQILWAFKDKGGFEAALGDIQLRCLRNPQRCQAQLDAMMAGIGSFFRDMNAALLSIQEFEFEKNANRLVRATLARFDAIFTLNQDLLLEHHYLDDLNNIFHVSNQKWTGAELPGLSHRKGGNFSHLDSPAGQIYTPLEQSNFKLSPSLQPLIKLHGSSNWEERVGGPILLMGTRKVVDQTLHPILIWYMGEFEKILQAGGTRLMVIGYGFRDHHINEVIEKAATSHGLQIFVIDPSGADVAWRANSTRGSGVAVSQESSLESAFKQSVIGASRRSLREIFGHDGVEHAKVMRFFQ